MGGPDVNPAIFLATMAGIIRQTMIAEAEQKDLGLLPSFSPTVSPSPGPTASPQFIGRRVLSSQISPTGVPSVGSPIQLDPEAVLTTILATMMISTCSFGAFIYILGRLRVSRGVQLVPGSVLSGFMASIGYLVILKALKTAMPHDIYDEGPLHWQFWAYFLPAIPIGVSMYLQKRWHVGSPVVILPFILVSHAHKRSCSSTNSIPRSRLSKQRRCFPRIPRSSSSLEEMDAATIER